MRWRFAVMLGLIACSKPNAPSVVPDPVAPAVAASADAIVFRVDFEKRHQHLLVVELAVPTHGRDAVVMMMPTWTPGSYLVREFARHVEGFEAFGEDGTPRTWTKVRKNRWRIETKGTNTLKLRYRVYARELSVRTSYVDAEYAIVNGATIFLGDVDHLDSQHQVELVVPADWPDVATSLDRSEGRYLAPDYDRLVDAPFLIGKTARFEFAVRDVPHVLVNVGDHGAFDGARAAKDLEKIASEQAALFGGLPYPRYLFLNVLSESRGGLEHLGSTVMMASRFTTKNEETYRRWLGLTSHELFHAWNGKRLRPVHLGPFDYENEVYTKDLWFVEGLTSYYDDLFVARAGLMNEKQWLSALERNITAVESKPGRQYQSMAGASYDSWIKFYRRDENTENSSVSYYSKGAVVGFVVDAMIRRTSRDRKSLDDVMREAYRRHSAAEGYTSDALYTVFEDVAGEAVRSEVERLVETTEPIDYKPALEWYGLAFEPKPSKPKDAKVYLGVETRRDRGRLMVTKVVRGTAAYEAGINVGDEPLAIGEDRIADLAKDLVGYEPGDEVEFLVSRRRRLTRLKVVLGEPPVVRNIRPADRRGATERRRLDRLLEGLDRS